MVAVTEGSIEASNAMHDELLQTQRELFAELGLHFRVSATLATPQS